MTYHSFNTSLAHPATPLQKQATTGSTFPAFIASPDLFLGNQTFVFSTSRNSGLSTPFPGANTPRNPGHEKENQPPPDILPSGPARFHPSTSSRKRKQTPVRHVDELPYTPVKRRSPRTVSDKLTAVFGAIHDANWTLADFLFYTFRTKGEDNKEIKRSTQHAMYVTHFLQGHTKYTPAMILDCWYRSPDGRVPEGSSDNEHMYSTTTVYTEIKAARAALTAFAAQTIEVKLVSEAKKAVEPSSGLHASMKKKGSQMVQWADVGQATVSRVGDIIKRHQPLTWHYLNRIAGKEAHGSGEKLRRPTDIVCTHIISSLNFTRNNEARILPLARGLLYFSFSAPADLIAYGSRVGEMPAYTTIYKSLKGLATHEAADTIAHARDPTKLGFLQLDNVQNYQRQRDHRIGLVNKMNIGIAATYCELEDVDVSAVDLADKRRRVAENKRASVTVDDLMDLIDQKHLDIVFTLHWLRVLINSIPELSKWKEHLAMLFREKAAKLQLPIKITKVHPLASSGKNETVTTELKDALYDFLAQLGQEDRDHAEQVIFAGGDGLTFQKMLELQIYLQFHAKAFHRLEILDPLLASWHTEWTDVSRVYETHWDSLLSPDPSSLGHSAAKINRAAPPTLKKVEYSTGVELMYLVLDVRILDCWRNHFKCTNIFDYFNKLSATGSLPEIEDLLSSARNLHRAFSSTRAIYHALGDTTISSDWTDTVPLGSSWVPTPLISSTQPRQKPSSSGTKSKGKAKPSSAVKRHPKGDRVLANTITFMRDALMSREISYAMAEGDAGRVYEIMKVLLFTFSGSSHTKYCTYLLESICRLELESSPALRVAALKASLVNLSGRAGSFTAADVMQEFFNRLLEAIVDKKGIEYGDVFIRNVISRNLHHFARIKLDLRHGVGLGKHSSRHSAPHVNPEVRTLLAVYQESELHCRRPGRVYEETDKDAFEKGLAKLRGGKLKKWIMETTTTRGLLQRASHATSSAPGDGAPSNEDDMTSDEEEEDCIQQLEDSNTQQPMGLVEVVDGELVISSIDMEVDGIDKWVSGLCGEPEEQGEDCHDEDDGLDHDMDCDDDL